MGKHTYVFIAIVIVLLFSTAVNAYNVDLSSFTYDSGVAESSGVMTFTEDIAYSAIFAFHETFHVPGNAVELAFNYSLVLGNGNYDWLVANIDTDGNGAIEWPDDYYLEIGWDDSGHWSIDLTPFRNMDIWLGFGLESNDFLDGTVATISNLRVETTPGTPVPLPGAVLLFLSGATGLAVCWKLGNSVQ